MTGSDQSSYVFGIDYRLGDLLKIKTRSEEIVAVVIEVELDIDSGKAARFTPVLGTPDAVGDERERIRQQIRSVGNRISYLERNWTVPEDAVKNSMLSPAISWRAGDLKTSTRASNDPQLGWYLCNGQALLREAFPELFSEIGTLYGSGDGSTTFNLPDFRGKFIMMESALHGRGASGGSETVNLLHHHVAPLHHHGVGSLDVNGTTDGRSSSTTNTSPESTNNIPHGPGPASTNVNPTNHTHNDAHTHESSNLGVTGETGDAGELDTTDSLSGSQSILNPYGVANVFIYAGVIQ
jgi:microcystin-dependent protein